MAITKIFGFDPASKKNLGWAMVMVDDSESGEPKQFDVAAGTFILPDVEQQWMVMWPIFSIMDAFFEKQTPDLVVVEQTSSFSGSFITGQVSACIGIIEAICGKYGVPVSFVYPSRVKKMVAKNGRAKKAQLKKAVIETVADLSGKEIKLDSDHAYDAVANVLCWLMENGFIEEDKESDTDE